MSKTTVSPTQLLSVTKTAGFLDCSRDHVYRLIAAGKLRAVETRASGARTKTRIRVDDLQAYIDANTQLAPTA